MSYIIFFQAVIIIYLVVKAPIIKSSYISYSCFGKDIIAST